jgi:hypothetical protein
MTEEDRNNPEVSQEEGGHEEVPEVYGVKKELGGWKFSRREFMAAAAAAAAAATAAAMATTDEAQEVISERVDMAGDAIALGVAMLAMVAVDPAEAFSQVWRFTNNSETTWLKGALLYLLDGNPMGGPTSLRVPDIPPGETVTVQAEMVAPTQPGTYQHTWRLQAAHDVPAVTFSPFVLLNGCIVESPHPYEDDTSVTNSVTNPDVNALSTRVHFSRIELDPGDYIVLKDSAGRERQRITESYPSGLWSQGVPGRVVRVQLVTDSSGTAWGFCLDQIETAGRVYLPLMFRQPSPTPSPTPTHTPTPTATPCACHGHCSCNPHCTCDRVCTCDVIHYWYPN